MINPQLFWVYVAVGALTELLTLRHPTPGQQWAAGLQVTVSGAFLAMLIPPEANTAVYICIFISSLGRIGGKQVAVAIDKARLWWAVRRLSQSEQYQHHGRHSQNKRP